MNKSILTRSGVLALTLAFGLGTAAPLLNSCAETKDRPSTGQYIDDRTITAKVKAKLIEDPLTKGLSINVDTYKGKVQLNGFVSSEEEKEQAEKLAKSVGGVKSVTNNLAIKGE